MVALHEAKVECLKAEVECLLAQLDYPKVEVDFLKAKAEYLEAEMNRYDWFCTPECSYICSWFLARLLNTEPR